MLRLFLTYSYFLGLRTLTVIQNAVRNVERSRGIKIDINAIDMNDPQVYASIATGRCEGVFQLESPGMKNFMKELQPGSLEDVIAGISLYRPGPMDFIPRYLEGKNHPGNIQYECPQLEPILSPTYGCIIYQEQVMQIVRNLAGYTLGRSDLVRRAMSKKKTAVMEQERQNFVYGNEKENVKGCIANGIDEKTANHIYDEMIDFAKYAFNKSHAAAYAVVAYQTAFIKYYYPVEYMAALMTSVIDNSAKVSDYIQVCRKMGIGILPPDVNGGEWDFSVKDNCICYALAAIKSVGHNVIQNIIRERNDNGKYRSLNDFLERNSSSELNKRAVENLIKAGALDCFDGNRRQKLTVFGIIMDELSKNKKNSMSGQMSLMDFMQEDAKSDFEIHFPDVDEFPESELLGFEKEVLGIYVSGHPLEAYRKVIEKNVTAVSNDFLIDDETSRAKLNDGQIVTVAGMITVKTTKTTRKNQLMAFLTIEDLYGTLEIILFPKDYEHYRDILEIDKKVFIRGRVSLGDQAQGKLICEKIMPFEAIPKELWIQFNNAEEYEQKKEKLFEILAPWDGRDTVVIYLSQSRQYQKLPAGRNVDACMELCEQLYQVFEKDNVKVVEKSIEKLWKIN